MGVHIGYVIKLSAEIKAFGRKKTCPGIFIGKF